MLQQSRVFHAAHDVLINATRLTLFHQFAAHALAVDHHCEVGDAGILWQREDVNSFQVAVYAVAKDLLYAGRGDAILDLDVHTLAFDGQRWDGLVLGNQHACSMGVNGAKNEYTCEC